MFRELEGVSSAIGGSTSGANRHTALQNIANVVERLAGEQAYMQRAVSFKNKTMQRNIKTRVKVKVYLSPITSLRKQFLRNLMLAITFFGGKNVPS